MEHLPSDSGFQRGGNMPSFRATARWKPTVHQLRRGRVLMLKEFWNPRNLTVEQFAKIAKKSRSQIYQYVRRRKLLAISVGRRVQHIPGWQIDDAKKKLTRTMLQKARNVDEWTLYFALSNPNNAFSGKPPIDIVTSGNVDQVACVLIAQFGFHG